MTFIASVMTVPSMQPPETDPTKEPSPLIANWLPTGRGEEPQVVTTVASATSPPSAFQTAARSSTLS